MTRDVETLEPTRDRPACFAGLHVLCDDDPRWPVSLLDQARAACEGGAAVLQLRAKHATDSQMLDWARSLRAWTREAGAALVVNDRFDLALACEADAVHLGQSDLPPSAIPTAARARLCVGRSTHTLEEALRSNDESVDYVAYGPVFGTRSKATGFDARGLEALAEIVGLVAPRPVIAIGGIAADDVERVLATGATGIAVISAVAGADSPQIATAEFVAQFERMGHTPTQEGANRG